VWFLDPAPISVGLGVGAVEFGRAEMPTLLVASGQDHSDAVTVATDAPWAPAVRSLEHWLTEQRNQRVRLRLVLSGRLVRWQLLPWQEAVGGSAELKAYTSLHFRTAFGQLADDWELLRSPQPPGRSTPVCAVDRSLLHKLGNMCRNHGIRLQLVAPYFSLAFDHWRRRLRGPVVWFGAVESDSMTLALMQRGRWLALHSERLHANWQERLPGLMAQIAIPLGIDAVAAPLLLTGVGAPPPTGAGLAFTWLPPITIGRTGASRLALGI